MERRFVVSLVFLFVLLGSMHSSIAITIAAAPDRTYYPTDGWRRTSPERQGINSSKLEDAMNFIETEDVDIRSITIIKNGYLVYEEYTNPYHSENTTYILYSCTKSVTSTLIGIAIDMGYIEGVHVKLLDFFPNRTIANLDDRKQNITLEHVLTMTAGFEWDEESYDQVNDYYSMRNSDDWVQFVLDKPMVYDPGTHWYYNTGLSHLLSAIITETTGLTALEFAEEHLFGTLGITRYAWVIDPDGNNNGGSSLAITAQAMAKFGFLFLNNGTWDDEQIVSEEWVENATAIHYTPYAFVSYGYQWWIESAEGIDTYSARGYQGQYIFVIPELDMVVTFTSSIDEGYGPRYLMLEFIVPAALDNVTIPTTPTTTTDPTATIMPTETTTGISTTPTQTSTTSTSTTTTEEAVSGLDQMMILGIGSSIGVIVVLALVIYTKRR